MYVLKVTISAAAPSQRIIPKSPVIDNSNTGFQNIFIQNGANDVYIGDSSVSSTNGILISANGSMNIPCPLAYTSDLKDFYVVSATGSILTIMVIP